MPSGHIDCYLNWLSLVVVSRSLFKAICIGGCLIWWFFGPSRIHQLKSPPNINRFTVYWMATEHSLGHPLTTQYSITDLSLINYSDHWQTSHLAVIATLPFSSFQKLWKYIYRMTRWNVWNTQNRLRMAPLSEKLSQEKLIPSNYPTICVWQLQHYG